MTARLDVLLSRLHAWADYARALLWRMRGARMGARCRVSTQCETTLAKGLMLGDRVVLERGVVLKLVDAGAEIRMDDHVFIGRGCIFDIAGGLSIGAGTLIAPGCFVTDHNHGFEPDMPIWQQACRTDPVTIGADVWLGAKVVILPGVAIGDGAVVAAGSVVTKSVEAMTIVAGVPAHPIRKRIRSDENV